MKIQMSPRFQRKLKRRFERFEYEVGILKDGPHYKADEGEKGIEPEFRSVIVNYAGGPVRKKSRTKDGTISEVAKSIREDLRVDWLRKPFKNPENKDILKLIRQIMFYAFGKTEKRRLENALQAVVRNPILRQDYDINHISTVERKGFDRYLIDTAQFFKAIKARVRIKNSGD